MFNQLASPTFATFIDVDSALKLVMDGAQVLEDVAVDKDHTPALCKSRYPENTILVADYDTPFFFLLRIDASFIRSLVAGRKSAENEDESSSYPENTASSSESQSASGNQQHTELPTHEIFVDGFNHTMDLGNLAGLKSFEAMDGLGKGDGFWDNVSCSPCLADGFDVDLHCSRNGSHRCYSQALAVVYKISQREFIHQQIHGFLLPYRVDYTVELKAERRPQNQTPTFLHLKLLNGGCSYLK